MIEDDKTALLQKISALQEQQLAKLSELVEVYTRAAESTAASRTSWDKQREMYEQSQKNYEERAERQARDVRIRGIIMLVLWTVIAIAVVVHYFF